MTTTTYCSYVLVLFLAVACVDAKNWVVIENNIGPTPFDLEVHCKSDKGDDRGNHVVSKASEPFEWQVDDDKSVYNCDLSFATTEGNFVVYNDQIASKCSNSKCYWRVQGEGLYFRATEPNGYEKRYSWPDRK